MEKLSATNRTSIQSGPSGLFVDDARRRNGSLKPLFTDVDAMKERLRKNMMQPTYDVAIYYFESGVFPWIARHPAFEKLTLGIIFFNAVWIWIDTDYNQSSTLITADPLFIVVDNFFCSFFVGEWLVRFLSFQRKRNCFRDFWFVFDSVMAALMALDTWVMTILLAILPNDGGGGLTNASMMRMLRLLRLTRMARMARLLQAVPELLILIKGIMSAMRSVLFTLLLLGLVLYVFGICFAQLTKDTPVGRRNFDTVPFAMHTLFLRGTLMEDMRPLVQELAQQHYGFAAIFYVFYIISASFLLNMLIGVLCEVVNAVAATEKEELTVNYVKSKLQECFQHGGLDTDCDGMISKDEFAKILDNPLAARSLTEVGVDVFGLVDLQDFIFEAEDENGESKEKQLSFCDFMEVVLQLRGSNNATVKDIVDLRKFVQKNNKMLEERVISKLRRASHSTTWGSEAGCPAFQKSPSRPCASRGLQKTSSDTPVQDEVQAKMDVEMVKKKTDTSSKQQTLHQRPPVKLLCVDSLELECLHAAAERLWKQIDLKLSLLGKSGPFELPDTSQSQWQHPCVKAVDPPFSPKVDGPLPKRPSGRTPSPTNNGQSEDLGCRPSSTRMRL